MRIALATCSSFPEGGLDDRPLIDALRRRGAEVSTPVWNDQSTDWGALDAVLIRSTWDYTDQRESFLIWAAAISEVTTLLSPLPLLHWNTTKTYLADLAAAGQPIIPTQWLTQPGVDLPARLAAAGWTEGFCKPLIGANSQGTRRLTGTAEDTAWLEELIASGGAMLQPFRDTVATDGEISAILVEGQLTHSLCKRPKDGDHRVQESFGATESPHTLTAAQAALVEGVVQATAERLGMMPLVMRVDLLSGPEGPELCEVELVEPCLFFRHHLPAADVLAEALLRRLGIAAATPPLRPPPRWPVVVFDLDGTVIDSSEIVVDALNESRAALGLIPVDAARIRSGIGLPLRGMVAWLSEPGEDVDAITAGYQDNYIRLAPSREAAFAGMKELIVDLAIRGVTMGVATGKSQRGAESASHRHCLDHWIHAIHGIVPGTPGKPDPAVLQRALDDIGVGHEQAVLIGDTSYDMSLATAIGVDAIGVDWGVHDTDTLTESGALTVAKTVDALRALLL